MGRKSKFLLLLIGLNSSITYSYNASLDALYPLNQLTSYDADGYFYVTDYIENIVNKYRTNGGSPILSIT